MKNLKLILVTFLSLSCTLIFSQNYYEGKFSKKGKFVKSETALPIGKHTSYHEEYDLHIETKYINHGRINDIKIVTGKDTSTIELPVNLEEIEWNQITEGLWINEKVKNEKFQINYDKNKKVTFHYVGYFLDSKSFDNSLIRNVPSTAKLGQLFEGFSIGISNMNPGELRVIKISPDLAYGETDSGIIPANSTLIYIIYIVKDKPGKS